MISKPLAQIGPDDLKALVGRVRESKTLELKASLPPCSLLRQERARRL